MGLPPQITENSDKKATKPAALPAVDHTIRIPERLAWRCWRAVFLCVVFAGLGVADAQMPNFRTQVSAGFDAVLYRLSLRNVQTQAERVWQHAVARGSATLLPEADMRVDVTQENTADIK